MNNKAKIVMVLAFVLALGAGVLTGMSLSGASKPPAQRSWLADDLKLSPQQKEQMKEIWSKALQGAGSSGERRRAAQVERDEAIARLIPEDRKGAYQQALQDYAAKMEEMNRERMKAFQDAVERTKLILDETQRQKYEEILKHRGEPGRGRGGRGPETTSRPAEGRTTQPAEAGEHGAK